MCGRGRGIPIHLTLRTYKGGEPSLTRYGGRLTNKYG
jgi:hypothetical protein